MPPYCKEAVCVVEEPHGECKAILLVDRMISLDSEDTALPGDYFTSDIGLTERDL